jgi:hypothetical protein
VTAEAVLAAARLMWPAPATVSVARAGATAGPAIGGGVRQEFVLVPSAANPKLVVPVGPNAAAARVLRSATAPGSLAATARSGLLGLGLRTGAGSRLLRDRLVVDLPDGAPALDDHLGRLLGREVLVGMRVGPPRANRKPVLQVVTPHGELVAYAKLGVNELTDALIGTEAAALTRLAGAHLGDVRIPALLHSGTWQSRALLVQAALPVRRSRRGGAVATRITAAMVSVSTAEGSAQQALGDLPWWHRTCAVVAALPPSGSADAIAEVGRHLAGSTGQVLTAGAWHGDWNPGNCSVLADVVLVWDWERYEAGVPAGFDALHLALHGAFAAGVAPRAAAGKLLTDAATLLAPFGVPSADARLVATAYLWGLGARYLQDDQAAAGAAVGRLETWLLPTLAQVCGLDLGLAGSLDVDTASAVPVAAQGSHAATVATAEKEH